MHARLRGSNNLLILHQIIIEPDFPSLADEIAKPRPDMNIKVAAFTVSEKSINLFTVSVWTLSLTPSTSYRVRQARSNFPSQPQKT